MKQTRPLSEFSCLSEYTRLHNGNISVFNPLPHRDASLTLVQTEHTQLPD